MSDDPERQLHDRAYRLWEEAGRPPDRALEHWLEAERQISHEKSMSSGTAVVSWPMPI